MSKIEIETDRLAQCLEKGITKLCGRCWKNPCECEIIPLRSGDNTNPLQDIREVREAIDVETYEATHLLGTTDQVITLKAMDLFTKWKIAWRKKHWILAFFERIINRIKGDE